MSTERSFEEIKNLIKDRADLPAIVSRHTKLVKTARGFKACCPIHKEKTPSFNIDTRGNYFYCYGCNQGGDVFKFLELVEGMSFFDALKDLAEQLHIELPKMKKNSGEQKADKTRRDQGFELLSRAQAFFNKFLIQSSSAEAEKARAYLNKRGLSLEEIQIFGVGLSPDSPNSLLKKITAGEDQKIAISADLLRDYNGKLYDSFRARLMIPIRDLKGRVVGFSGRVLEGAPENQPKYKNTSETEWFKKKEILYGLDLAVKQIRQDDYVCLVEGYFDQWAFYRKDIPAVAVMGTALSEEHLEQISRQTNNVILVLDTDRAGMAATQRSLPLLLKKEMSVRVFAELGGKDPDEWLASFKGSSADIKKKLMTAPSAIEWWTRTRLQEKLATNPDRLSAIKDLEELWHWTHSAAQRNILCDEASRILGMSSRDIKESLQESKPPVQNKNFTKHIFSQRSPAVNPVRPSPPRISNAKIYIGPLEVLAQESLTLWFQHLEWVGPHKAEDWTAFDKIFDQTPLAPFIEKWKKTWFEDPSAEAHRKMIEESVSHIEPENRARAWILKALVGKDPSTSSQEQTEAPTKDKILKSWDELSQKVARERIREEIVRLQSKIREASSDSELSNQLLKKVQELMKELHY